MILALPLVALVALTDPRPGVVEHVLQGGVDAALASVEAALEARPEESRGLGLDYARADLLERLGQTSEADAAFTVALASPLLAGHARLRLADLRLRLGQAEVAAGLLASLVAEGGRGPDPALAVALLRRALAAGGDCGSLTRLRPERLGNGARRELELARAECAERGGRPREAAATARGLLSAATGDALARDAAELLARATLESGRTAEERLLLARAAYDHREFALARTLYLEALGPEVDPVRHWREAYALARCEFWLGELDGAAERFRALARTGSDPDRRADALFQAGRSLELAGRVAEALAAFDGATRAGVSGSWAAAARLAALRLVALSGDEPAALARLGELATRPQWRSAVARGALFLASGRLARGEPAGTAELLALAARSGAASAEEVAYWRGRLAELEGSHARAVKAYLEALRADPFHPFARFAAARLRSESLVAAARALGWSLSSRSTLGDLRSAALLLGAGDAVGAEAERAGRRLAAREPGAAVWLEWRPVPVAEWPLWSHPATRAEDLLLAIGRFAEAPGAVPRRFPASEPRLAFTGSWALAEAGEARRALALVESLFERRPAGVPIEWVSPHLRAQLYPFHFGPAILARARERGIDPHLLAGLLREESRFDAGALSPASARGLAQLVPATARGLAARTGLPVPSADDLFRPEVSIALGAAYLAELSLRFDGRIAAAVAAYNAGEAQAALWLRYCSTQDEAEFLSKVGFRETRAYLQRVLGSRAHYAALYPEPSAG